MRRAAKVDANHGEIVEALLSVSGVTVHSLAGVGCGCPDLLVGAEGQTFLVEVKDGEKRPSHRTLTPDQRKWIERWTGAPVVILLDASKALAWARRIAAAPSTFAGVFGRPPRTSAAEGVVIITALIGPTRRPPAVFPQYSEPFAIDRLGTYGDRRRR